MPKDRISCSRTCAETAWSGAGSAIIVIIATIIVINIIMIVIIVTIMIVIVLVITTCRHHFLESGRVIKHRGMFRRMHSRGLFCEGCQAPQSPAALGIQPTIDDQRTAIQRRTYREATFALQRATCILHGRRAPLQLSYTATQSLMPPFARKWLSRKCECTTNR